jgi:hypothetical protein
MFDIKKATDPFYETGNVWSVEPTQAMIAAALLRRPDAHPVWHDYLVSIVHLRKEEGVELPIVNTPGASHEICITALSPSNDNQPDGDLFPLSPPNLAYQVVGLDDEKALRVYHMLLDALSIGLISPQSDYNRLQKACIDAAMKKVCYG